MSDAIKWALLVAGVVSLILIILSMPFAVYLGDSATEVSNGVTKIVSYCGQYFRQARGFINCFLTSSGRTVLSGLILYFFTKYFVKLTVKITAWIFHFIFK